MVACQELSAADVELAQHVTTSKTTHVPAEPSPAVADAAIAAVAEPPTEETFAAMRWASQLEDDSSVLGLLRSLPKEVVEEQVALYKQHAETAVAGVDATKRKHVISTKSRLHTPI